MQFWKIFSNILKQLKGFKDNVIKWLQSYLSNRSFTVQLKRTKSGQCYIKIGVPQGSILGPLLFILFTKDIENIAEKYQFSFHCYADDCQIYFCFRASSSEEPLSKLEMCLVEIKTWMTHHFLKLNNQKTEVLEVFPFYNQSPSISSIQYENVPIPTQNAVKSLGVYFDSKLLFQRHANEVANVCNFRLKNMSRIGSKLDDELKKVVAQSYIMNKIDYCNVVYSSLNQNSINKLQTIQNAAARFVAGVHSYNREWRHEGSMHELLFSLHFLPVKYRVKYKICLLCYKCLNDRLHFI